MKTVIPDTYAWIEYFRGTKEGKKARKYIDGDYELVVPSIVIAELRDKYVRNEMEGRWEKRRKFLKLKAEIDELGFDLAEKAAELKWELREKYNDVGMADAIILAHTQEKDAKLLTGDKHLTHREEVEDLR